MRRSVKLLLNSVPRYKRSRGFGIHSPFAYSFVTRVLGERLQYYPYHDIALRRNMAMNLASQIAGHRRVISKKNARLVFRVACYFNPDAVLQIGTTYGVSTTAILDVSRSSRLVITPGTTQCQQVYDKVTHRYGDRIISCQGVAAAIAAYRTLPAGTPPFIMVNSIDSDADMDTLYGYLMEALGAGGTVLWRNLLTSERVAALHERVNGALHHGMTFTNGRMSIVVGALHLPRQRFNLWF